MAISADRRCPKTPRGGQGCESNGTAWWFWPAWLLAGPFVQWPLRPFVLPEDGRAPILAELAEPAAGYVLEPPEDVMGDAVL
jgi:hypothetical protein